MRWASQPPSVGLVHDEGGRDGSRDDGRQPRGSEELYEQIRAHIGLDKPAGGIFHIAGPSPNGGWRVIEVWDSEEEAHRFFQEQFIPALQALGIEGGPPPREFWPVHNAMR
jgi:hypothetical protein